MSANYNNPNAWQVAFFAEEPCMEKCQTGNPASAIKW
jgi:hypothetical protein